MSAPDWVWDLVQLSASLAASDAGGMEEAFERLKASGREAEVEESLLQSYLFLGFPAAIEAFRGWRTHSAQPPEGRAEGWELWAERGAEVCSRVYGGKYERLRANIARFHPDLDAWMVVEGYGKVLGRPGLSLAVREMCIVAMLVVQGARRQLRSHLQGALNAGATRDQVEEVIRRAGRFAGREKLELAEKLWSALMKTGG